jgi:rhodanese-related sulfurtransferase
LVYGIWSWLVASWWRVENQVNAEKCLKRRRIRRLLKITSLLFFSWFCIASFYAVAEETESQPTASETQTSLPTLKEIEVSGPYCGIYSLVACLNALGVTPDIQTLLVPDYVGSFQGSSDKELIKAAEANGLYGKTYGNLTWQELQKSNSPMILHFRSSFSDQKYNHWVAYLGVDGGKARIIDVPHELATIPFAELMAKWDGTSIVISDKPIDGQVKYASMLNYLGFVSALLGAMFLTQILFWNQAKEAFTAKKRFERLKRGVLQTSFLLGTIFVIAITYHACSSVGLLRNPTAVAEVTRRYYSVDIPEIPLAEMQRIVDEKNTPLFDARYVRDYNHGTIPGAISLPISSSLTERQQQLQGIDKTKRLVVFCQSAGCAYADEVAQFLKFNGYNNVVIYRGGYREWDKNKAP